MEVNPNPEEGQGRDIKQRPLLELEAEEKRLRGLVQKLKEELGFVSKKVSAQLKLTGRLGSLMEQKSVNGVMEYVRITKSVTSWEVANTGTGGMGLMVDGRKDAVAILPEEMWRMILGNVKDPKDLWNLCNTCQIFDAILSPWKTGWLLSQALPYVYKDLSGAKLLECRTICKSWKEAVDNFLDDHVSIRPYNHDNWDPRRLDFVNPMMEKNLDGERLERYEFFTNSSDMAKFEDPEYQDEWKRLIGKQLYLDLGMDYNDHDDDDKEQVWSNESAEGGFPRMWTKFYEFLSTFGEKVWYLTARYYLNDEHGHGDSWEVGMLPFLTNDVFRIFPNLRTLRLAHENVSFYEENEDLQPELPLPAPKLETLEGERARDVMLPTLFPRFHVQLRKLHLAMYMYMWEEELEWPNLVELQLRCEEDYFDCFQQLSGVGVRMPQLQKLGIRFEEVTDGEWKQLFPAFFSAVRDLCLTTRLNTLRVEGGLWGWAIGEGDINGFYDQALAQLRTLEFGHHTERASAPDYSFLLRCFPFLENLNVFIRREPDPYPFPLHPNGMALEASQGIRKPVELGKEQEIVEVNKYMFDGLMYKSNIWEVMPFLNVFTFQWDIYTRAGYEEYKMKKVNKKI